MKTRILAIALVLALAGTSTVWAEGPITPQHSDPYWQAWYWNNTTLSGLPALQRSEANLDYDWGYGSPDPAISPDRFSARWTRYIEVPPGTYRFTATSDDGIRVWVDGALLINEWYDHAPKTVSADRALGAGHHLILVEFYENTGGAVARLSWALATPTITYWRGEYFNNPTLTGVPTLVRDDPQVHFNWGLGSPAPGLLWPDGFSVRWTRNLDLPAGMYRFTVTADDGVRLWVNRHLLVDAWRDQAPTTYTGDIYLGGGPIPVQMEYYENTGGAVAQLSWAPVGPMPPPPPPMGAVIVDDTDAGFVRGGLPTSWRTAPEGYGGRLTWTRNNDRIRYNYNWARWYPNLRPARYEVFVYVPERYSTTGAARYWVSHAGGYTLRVVNQSANSGRWVSLGTYGFRGNRSDYVSLADVTYEPYLTRLIAFDAVKWEPR
ncbi:MAG: PA14 domain-containing protein [Anaerolineae bacterium]